MQSSKAFIVVVSVLLLSVLSQPVFALTFDYLTTAEALAEVGWNDYLVSVAETILRKNLHKKKACSCYH